MIDINIERHIRCNCGKYWGMGNHKRNCKKCKTPVIARGELGNKIRSNSEKKDYQFIISGYEAFKE